MNVIAPICPWMMSWEHLSVTNRGLPKRQFVWHASLCYDWIPWCGCRMDRQFHFKMIIRFELVFFPHVITWLLKKHLFSCFLVLALVPSIRNPTDVYYSIAIYSRLLTTLHSKSFSLSVLHTISKSEVIFSLFHSDYYLCILSWPCIFLSRFYLFYFIFFFFWFCYVNYFLLASLFVCLLVFFCLFVFCFVCLFVFCWLSCLGRYCRNKSCSYSRHGGILTWGVSDINVICSFATFPHE